MNSNKYQKKYFCYTFNSTALFIISYLMVYLACQAITIITASYWNLETQLYYYKLDFNNFSPLWNRLNIILVSLSAPLFSLIIGIFFYRLIVSNLKLKRYRKLVFLWISMHGFTLFFGAFTSGVIFGNGFGYVTAWLRINVFWQFFIALIFLFVLGTIGYYSTSQFLGTSNIMSRVRGKNKVKFLIYQVIIPWILGSVIICLIKLPHNQPYDLSNMAMMMFCLVPVLFNREAKVFINPNKGKKPTKINWVYFLVLLFIIVSYRVGLNNGFQVILDYEIIFSLNITPL